MESNRCGSAPRGSTRRRRLVPHHAGAAWHRTAAAACGVLLAALAGAQTPPPNPHWGASLWPAAHRELRGAFSFNRFTEFTSTGRRFPSAIEETTGFNLFDLSYTEEITLGLSHRFTYTFDVAAGYSSDQPTEFLQNRYVHDLRDLGHVRVEDRRTASEYAAGGAAYYWLGTDEPHRAGRGDDGDGDHHHFRWQAFAGAGVSVSTIYHEAFVQVGGSLLFPDLFGSVGLRLSALDRLAWPHGSDAYPEVAAFANVAQAGIAFVPADHYLGDPGWRWSHLLPPWLDLLGRPEVGFWVTWDSGLFVDLADDPIDTTFLSIRFDWNTGLRLETWNDFANGTDYGPTYGFMLSFDFRTLFRSDR